MSDPGCAGEHRFFCMRLLRLFRKLHAEYENITDADDIALPNHPLALKVKSGVFTEHVVFGGGQVGGQISAIIHHGSGVKGGIDIIDDTFQHSDIHDSYGEHMSTCSHIHIGYGHMCFASSNSSTSNRSFALHYERRGPQRRGRRALPFFGCVAAIIGAASSAAAVAATSTAASAAVTAITAVAPTAGEAFVTGLVGLAGAEVTKKLDD